MPVTAKLSKAFCDRLGEQVANELVEWFNAVDLTYRTELRELNDLHFARFEATLEARLAELKAEVEVKLAQMEARIERRLGEQSRWLFAAWLSLLIPIIGLWFRG